MNPTSTSFSSEDLYRHRDFLRSLARRLVGQGSDAEELVQRTWTATLTQSMSGVVDPRAWLARVMTNFARMDYRGKARRSKREEVVARSKQESVPAAGEIAANLETQQQVATAAAELEEPYRTAIYLRYYENRESRQIAEDLGVPVETVRTRLKRGVAMLRSRLDDDCGGRERWMALLIPFAQQGQVLVTTQTAGTLAGLGVWIVTSKMKLWLAASAILLAIAGGVYVVMPGASEVTAESSGLPAKTVLLEAPEASRPVREEVVTAEAPDTVADEEPAPAQSIELRGRMVLLEDGMRIPGLSGTFTLIHWTDGRVRREKVEVLAGQWMTEVLVGSHLAARSILLGGRLMATEGHGFSLPTDHFVELEVHPLHDILLHVVDGETKTPLSNVEVRMRRTFRSDSSELHPGDSLEVSDIGTGLNSPVTLPKQRSRTVYWAHASGYAWGRIVVLHEQAGERTVELFRGGRLTVHIDGPELPGDCHIRLREIKQAPAGAKLEGADLMSWMVKNAPKPYKVLDVQVNREGPTIVDDMLHGSYQVYVEKGVHFGVHRLGEARVQIVVGQDNLVRVQVRSAEQAQGTLAGTITLPESVAAHKDLRLMIFPTQGGRAKAQRVIFLTARDFEPTGEPDEYAWEAGEVILGDYVAQVFPLMHRVGFSVEADGNLDLDIQLPPIAELEFFITDKITGQVVIPTSATFHDGGDETLPDGGSTFSAQIDTVSGRVRITSVEGPINLSIECADHVSMNTKMQLSRGMNRPDIALNRVYSMRFKVRHKGALLPQGWQFWSSIKVEYPPNFDHSIQSSSTGTSETRKFRTPGTYRVLFPKLDGYKAIAPREVELTGGLVEVVFDLETES